MQKKIIKNGDNVVSDGQRPLPRLCQSLGQKACGHRTDAWHLDARLSSANPVQPVMFRYTAAGQGGAKKGQTISDEVQDEFKYYSQKAGLQFTQSKLLNDGGN